MKGDQTAAEQLQLTVWELPVSEQLQGTTQGQRVRKPLAEERQGQQVRKPLAEDREHSQPALGAVAVDQGTELEPYWEIDFEAE